MKYQMASIEAKIADTYDTTYINAPNHTIKTYPKIAHYFPDEVDFYQWYERMDDGSLEGLDRSIEYLKRIVPKYDAILAFSQGGSILSFVSSFIPRTTKVVVIGHGLTVCENIDREYASKVLYLIGRDDEMRQSIESNARKWYTKSHIAYYPASHRLPSDRDTVDLINSFL
jgi:hypothetical protein